MSHLINESQMSVMWSSSGLRVPVNVLLPRNVWRERREKPEHCILLGEAIAKGLYTKVFT